MKPVFDAIKQFDNWLCLMAWAIGSIVS